jgi:hypothetical protein
MPMRSRSLAMPSSVIRPGSPRKPLARRACADVLRSPPVPSFAVELWGCDIFKFSNCRQSGTGTASVIST